MGGLTHLLVLLLGAPGAEPPGDPPNQAARAAEGESDPAAERPAREGERLAETGDRTIVVEPRTPEGTEPDRASTVVTRRDLEERLPRSAPDAIRYEPGVYVQHTAHAQASAYVRGMTGQQVVTYVDGIRLNNSTFRQGPNQYFFTVDSRTLDSLEVIRGSASTRWGADALGGAVLTTSIDPTFDRAHKWNVHPRAMLRTGTADGELGGRAQIDLAHRDRVGVIAGVGYRDVGQLKAGGELIAPATGEVEKVPPLFADDGKTQLGTGFKELTADGRVVWNVNRRHRLTAAAYDYRQTDAPRTDKCPPDEGSVDACLEYLEQFRTLTYLAWDLAGGPAPAETMRWTVHYQRQHERRRDRPGVPPQSYTTNLGRDDVHTIGTRLQLGTRALEPTSWFRARFDYGVDSYYDVIDSHARTSWSDTNISLVHSRGQYLDGAWYSLSGAWAGVETTWWERLTVRAGGRGALAHARADGDVQSDSASVEQTWGAAVGNAGLAVRATRWLRVLGSVDQGFRAPNLDDLTSRQQTGPGFQRENADLDPERSLSLETGLKILHPWIEVDAFVFQNRIQDLIQRRSIEVDECPPMDTGCTGSRTRWQLQNASDLSILWGVDGGMRVFLPWDLYVRASIAWMRGDMPNPVPGEDPDRVAVSRVPPLNGTGEAGWRPTQWGFNLAAVVRWAALQDRLAPADVADPRIPRGGTPAFAVFDVRAGYRFDPHVLLGLVFENVGDTAYRYHGSSVNGPGRSLLVNLELGL